MVLFYILVITSISFYGSWQARKTNNYDTLAGLYITFIIMSQILASKIAIFDIFGHEFVAPSAILVFTVTFLITDLINEKFGRKAVQKLIFQTFIAQVLLIFFLKTATYLQPAEFWPHQEAWESIFNVVPRILIASWVTFLVSGTIDAYLYEKVRIFTRGKHLWARNVFSTLPALSIDTLLFVTIAFYGLGIPLIPLMIGQFVLKYIVGIICIPFMYANKAILGESHYDQQS